MRKLTLAWALALALITAPVAAQQTGVAGANAPITQGPWVDFAPSPSVPGPGSVTTWGTHVGRYQRVGKTINLMVVIRVMNNGTGAGYVQVALPVAARSDWRGGCTGWAPNSPFILAGFVTGAANALGIFAPNQQYPGGSLTSFELWMNCTYEAA